MAFKKAVAWTVICIAAASIFCANLEAADRAPIILTSSAPAERWEDALISGNGIQGVMVHGNPLDETIVLNHEKCWVPAQPVKPDVPDTAQAMRQAQQLALQGKFREAGKLQQAYNRGNEKMFPAEALIRSGHRLGLNFVHPALHLKIALGSAGEVADYRGTHTLGNGEINVLWHDDRGDWQRSTFVSRPDNVVVTRLQRPTGGKLSAKIRFVMNKGWQRTPQDWENFPSDWDKKPISTPTIEYRINANGDGEIYLHTQYKLKHGLPEAEGYHSMARVVHKGGKLQAEGDRLEITDADEVLVLTRTEFLPIAKESSRDALRQSLASLPADYNQLLAKHAAVHGEIFRRVTYRVGGDDVDRDDTDHYGGGRTIEEILTDADANGPTPALLELIFAVGRYCLISSSGELPPTLMGIWGDTWRPMWWGHYTNDSNLNLAVSGGSVGNMPEMMESYFSWIESLYPDWERNASQIYGARGYMGAIAHGWRHGLAIAGWQQWTGAAGWLGAYFWQHYLLTGDQEFLAERTVPLLENIVAFYEDFLGDCEQADGKFLIYPSQSPENWPPGFPQPVPNSTSEIAIIRATFTALIDAYRELGIKEDRIPELEAFLEKVPEYRINEDGAIAEWSYPGVQEKYNHRHNSHLHAVYPGVDINPSTPKLYEAAKVAIQKRLAAGQGNKSAHGFMELGFFGSRLQDPSITWDMLDDYAREKFLYRSFISSHNPDHRIYNLDSILSLPAILTEMCLYSRPGELNLLPGIPPEHLPQGEIAGILARKAIVVDQLKWDLPARKIELKLTSKLDQTVQLTSRVPIESVKVSGSEVSRVENSPWNVDLPAGKQVALTIGLSNISQ